MKENLVTADSMKEVTQICTHPSAKQLHPLRSGFPHSLHLLPSTTVHSLFSSAVYDKEGGGAGS